MVDAITGYIVNKISDYLVQEASLLLGAKEEVEGLKEELQCIRGFLNDVEQDEDDMSNAFREWTNLVRDIAYEAEDILDSYLLKVKERERSKNRFLGLIKKWFCIICEKTDAYRIANDIRSLKKKINDLSSKFERYCNKNNHAQKATSSKLRELKEIRRAPSFIEEEHVVGVENEADFLLEKLLNGDSKTYMISIYGTGGLGKTTLARKLYNSTNIKRRFEYRAWTCVSQEYKTEGVLQSIIESFLKDTQSELERIKQMRMTKVDLERYLHRYLEGKRYLVVVDDVWKKEAWESLKRSFPRNVDGSRVIMTTRNKDVAEGVDERVYPHSLRFLPFNESWELFRKKAFRDHKMVNKNLEEMGKDMVQKCGGLPLAIIVLAGMLSRKNENEWCEVRDHIWRNLRSNSIHISGLLDLSFNDLHHELKLCFLYLSIFPEDWRIDVEELIHLLVAEGFIQKDDEILEEDMAEQYIHELVNKSLVQVEQRQLGRIKSCRVHDLLRDLALKKAKELSFINVCGGHKPSSVCRREVIHHTTDTLFFRSSLDTRVRSLFLFEIHGGAGLEKHDYATICEKFKLLRVFYCSEKWNPRVQENLPGTIGELIHLRYLKLEKRLGLNFPTSFSNLRCLQTLDASSWILWKSIDLRNLTSLRHIYGRFGGDLLIGEAINLQTLDSVSPRCWMKINQKKLINLRKLAIDGGFGGDIRLGLGSFSKLNNLRVLTVISSSFQFSPAEYPPNLESLMLELDQLEEDPMPVLEKLPKLEKLVLEVENYPRKKLSSSTKGFPELKILTVRLPARGVLHIEDDAMPNLMELEHDAWYFTAPERLKALIGSGSGGDSGQQL